MTFSEALELLKRGKKVTRSGWNGKDMWIAIMPAHQVSEGSHLMESYVYMKTAKGTLIPWLASQADLLATDWETWETYR